MLRLSPKPNLLTQTVGLRAKNHCFKVEAVVTLNRAPEIHVTNMNLFYSCRVLELDLKKFSSAHYLNF